MNTNKQEKEQDLEGENTELVITNKISRILYRVGKWGRFLAVLGFVVTGLMVLAGFVISVAISAIPSGITNMPFPPYLFGLIYLVIGIVYFFPILYFYRFSSGIRTALHSKNQNQLAIAFSNLKAHYRFIGIFTIVMFALYLVMIVVMIIAGIFSGFTDFTGMLA